MKNKSFSIPKSNGLDKTIEIVSLAMVLAMIIVPIVLYSRLPERIPSHYNIAGEIDSYSSRVTVFILPIVCLLVVYLPLTILQCFPNIHNVPVEVTAENAEILHAESIRLIRYTKLLIIVDIAILLVETLMCAFAIQHGKFLFWILGVITFVLLPMIFIVEIKRMKRLC